MRESANKDLWPPLSSESDCFQTPPNATRTSSPSMKSPPSGGSSLAIVPGNSIENIEPKSLQATELNKLCLRNKSSLFQSIKHTVNLSNHLKCNCRMITPAEAESETINGKSGSPIVNLNTFNSRNCLTEILVMLCPQQYTNRHNQTSS